MPCKEEFDEVKFGRRSQNAPTLRAGDEITSILWIQLFFDVDCSIRPDFIPNCPLSCHRANVPFGILLSSLILPLLYLYYIYYIII